jgi:NADH-quinone oxidoreductase subunit G
MLEYADVVLPVAAAPEKTGTYVDWEGRPRPFETVLQSDLMPDGRVLALVAAELGADFGSGTVAALRSELAEFNDWDGANAADPNEPAADPAAADAGQVVLASWRQLLDQGVLQRGESALAGTQRDVRARMSATTAAANGIGAGDQVTVTGPRGSITLAAEIVAAADGVVWVPANSAGSRINEIGARPGDVVQIGGAS